MSVTAVVVSYNVRDLLVVCLESLHRALDQGSLAGIIVVDNDSSDDSVDVVRNRFPAVSIIESGNLGYGAGANRGIELVQTDYVLVLNPDTVVPPATIRRLARFLDDNPGFAVAAPRLRYPDGSTQSSRRRFPRRLTPIMESTIFERLFPGNRWARRYRMEDTPENRTQTVDWVVGACLMVRMDAVKHIGGFDESFWMYCEEVEWCWRFRRHGWKTVYLPDVGIIHHEGASTSQDIGRRQLAFDRSRVKLQRRLYGPGTALLAAAGIQAGYRLQIGIEMAKLLLGHRRELRRKRVSGYLALARAGLHTGSRHS